MSGNGRRLVWHSQSPNVNCSGSVTPAKCSRHTVLPIRAGVGRILASRLLNTGRSAAFPHGQNCGLRKGALLCSINGMLAPNATFAGNEIGDHGAGSICRALEVNGALRTLHLESMWDACTILQNAPRGSVQLLRGIWFCAGLSPEPACFASSPVVRLPKANATVLFLLYARSSSQKG